MNISLWKDIDETDAAILNILQHNSTLTVPPGLLQYYFEEQSKKALIDLEKSVTRLPQVLEVLSLSGTLVLEKRSENVKPCSNSSFNEMKDLCGHSCPAVQTSDSLKINA